MKLSRFKLFLLSIVAPILVTFIGVQSSYWFNMRNNLDAISLVYFVVAYIVGSLVFKQISFSSKPILIVAWLVYLTTVFIIILWVSLLAACGRGDCL